MALYRPKTLEEALRIYADAETCATLVTRLRWPGGKVQCPACGSSKVWRLPSEERWKCKGVHTGTKFSLRTGTFLQGSPLGLDKWLPVIWMLANSRREVNSQEAHRRLGVTQKTAWMMLQRGRCAIDANDLYGGVDLHDIFRLGRKRDPAEWKAWNRAQDRRGEMVEGAEAYGRFCRVLQATLWVPYAEVRRRMTSARA